MTTQHYPDQEYGMDPTGRLRFYGIYEGKVTSINDPLKKNRIQVTVSQPTGQEVHGWARAVLPVTVNETHADHVAHTAASVAALLTTTPVSAGDPQGGSVSIPALTVVAKSGAGTLTHAHKTVTGKNSLAVAADNAATTEHTPHRTVPDVGQLVWIMFIAGDPEYPVWIGVQ